VPLEIIGVQQIAILKLLPQAPTVETVGYGL